MAKRREVSVSSVLSTVSGHSAAVYVASLVTMVSGPIVARSIGADGKGLVATATTVSGLVALVVGLGFPVAVRRFAASGPAAVRSSIALGSRVALGSIPACLLIAVVFNAVAGEKYDGWARPAVALVILSAPLGVLRGFGAACMTATGNVAGLAAVRAVPPIVLSVVSVALVVAGHLSVEAALLALLLFAFVEALLALWGVGLHWREAASFGSLLPFSLKALPGQLAEASAVRLDQVLIFGLVATAEVGRYAVAVTAAGLPTIVLTAIQARDFTRIASASPPEARVEAARFVRRGFVTVSMICVPLALLSPWVITLVYGPEFGGMTSVLLLLFVGTAMLSLSYGAASALVALGAPGSATIGWGVAVLVTVVLEYPFAKALGITGAAIVSALAYGSSAAVHLVLLRKQGVRDLRPRLSDGLIRLGRDRAREEHREGT